MVAMGNFVVTGTRTPQAADTAPVRVEVLPSVEATRLGARSFADAMEYIPGVQVEANCQNCNTTELRLMGLSGAYNQIAFDGLPMLSSLAGVYGVEQVPASFIERIEVVKGGGSSLYGASAVAGVVNIIPRRPQSSGGSADYRVDLIDGQPAHQAGVSLNVVSPDQANIGSAYIQLSQSDPVDLDGDGFTEITRRRLQVAGFRGVWRRGVHEWTLDANYTHEDRRGGNDLGAAPHLTAITEDLNTKRYAATLALDAHPHASLDYRLVAAIAYTERDSFYGGLGDVVTDPGQPAYDPAVYREALALSQHQYGYTDNPLAVIEAQFNHTLANRTFSWGLQGEYEDLFDQNLDHTGAPTDKPPLDGEFTNIAAFVQDDWRISETVTLLSGARIDQSNQLDHPVVSPRLALRYAGDEYFSLRANLSTGFRAPRIFDEDLHIDTLGATPIDIVNAPALRKETAVTANFGFTWNPRPVADALAFEGNLFAAHIKDAFQLSEIRTRPDGSLFQERFNAGGVRVHGIEFNAAYSLTAWLRVDAGFTLQATRLDSPEVIFDDGAGTVINTDRFNKTPDQLGIMKLQYENEDTFDWSVGLRYIGPMRVLNNTTGTFNRVGSFLVLDASIGKHVTLGDTRYLLQTGVRNLTDDRQKDFETGANRDSDYVYGPRAPRSYFLSVKAEW